MGRGAERLTSPTAQGIYCQSFLGPLQQGQAEEAADGMMIRLVRVDEKVVHHNDSTMKEQQQQEEAPNKFKLMHKALLKATEMETGVKEIKCRLCPETQLKTLQDFKRHCNTVEAHPLEISFCDRCGDFFARRDSLKRHQKNPPPECRSKSDTEKEAKEKRRVTRLAHDDFLMKLEECLKTGKGFEPFSQTIKNKYPKSSKKRIGGNK